MGDEASVAAGQADGAAGPAAEAPDPDLLRREVLISGGHGAAFAVRAGQLVEIIDLEGQQVADFVAFAERNRTEWLSTTHTRSALLRLTAVVGDRLESNWRHPMFEIIRDDVGRNDIITSMCDDRRYLLPPGKAGDKLVLRTLMDSIVSVSACPQDLNPCNGFHPSPLMIRILEPSQDPS